MTLTSGVSKQCEKTLEDFAATQQRSTCSRLAGEKCGYDGRRDCPCGSCRKPKKSVMKALDRFGRIRLSEHYFMRDFLYSEIAAAHGIVNVPCDVELAVKAGRGLCKYLLEPLRSIFGHVTIRSAFRSCAVNGYGNCHDMSCSSNKRSYADHVWDHLDQDGFMGATACIVIPWFIDSSKYKGSEDWRPLAWSIHDNLPYSEMVFFPRNAAFNLTWREEPKRKIKSHTTLGTLTMPGHSNHAGDHSHEYGAYFPDPRSQTGAYVERAMEAKRREDGRFQERVAEWQRVAPKTAYDQWRRNRLRTVRNAWRKEGRSEAPVFEMEQWYGQRRGAAANS